MGSDITTRLVLESYRNGVKLKGQIYNCKKTENFVAESGPSVLLWVVSEPNGVQILKCRGSDKTVGPLLAKWLYCGN